MIYYHYLPCLETEHEVEQQGIEIARSHSMSDSAKRQTFFVLAILGLFFLFFYRLSAMGLIGPDEPRYAEVAKEMFISGDYVTPHLLGRPWFEKPPLYYWTAAFAYSLLGINETAARLPSATAACLLILFLFFGTRRVLSLQERFLSSLFLSTNMGIIAFSHGASTDMLLTSTFSIGMILIYRALHEPGGTSRRAILWVAYGMLGLSVLAKGPVGVLLTILILGVYCGIIGQWQSLRRLRLLLGAIIVTLVAAPWYIQCYRANGWYFVSDFLIQHNLMRFATNEFQHPRPIWFYLAVILAGMLPWSFLFVCLGGRLQALRQKAFWKEHPQTVFLIVWTLVPLAFFTLAQSKLPGYILPVFVPLAIMLGKVVANAMERDVAGSGNKRSLHLFRWGMGLELVFLAGILIFHQRLLIRFGLLSSGVSGWLLAACATAVTILVVALLIKDGPKVFLVGQSILTITAVFVISTILLPRLDPTISTRPMAQAIQRENPLATVLVWRESREVRYGLNFYLSTPPEEISSLEELAQRTSMKDTLVVLPHNQGWPGHLTETPIFQSSLGDVLRISKGSINR